MNCPKCGGQTESGQAFCGRCGAKLPAVCPACKQEVPAGQAFCGNCGTPLGQAAKPPAAPPPQPAYAPPPQPPPPPQPAAPPRQKSGCGRTMFIGCIVIVFLGIVGGAVFFLSGGLEKIEELFSGTSSEGRQVGPLDPDIVPVTLTRPTRGMVDVVPGHPVYTFVLKNVSKAEISAVKVQAVLFDEKGRRISDEGQEVGLSAGVSVKPGDEFKCQFAAEKDAASVALVVKEVVYTMIPAAGKNMEMYSAAAKWRNPRFDQEMKAAKAP